MPFRLPDLIRQLPRILLRLDAFDEHGYCRADSDRSRPRQIRDFRSSLPARLRAAS
jgi:hypothetical protein